MASVYGLPGLLMSHLTRSPAFRSRISRYIAWRGGPNAVSRAPGPDAVVSERVRKPQAQEAAMTGLILLVFIGVIVAFAWTRLRGKMKLGVSGKHWLGPIVIVVLVVLLMWSVHTGH